MDEHPYGGATAADGGRDPLLALVDRSVALDGTVPEYWFPGQSRVNRSRDNH